MVTTAAAAIAAAIDAFATVTAAISVAITEQSYKKTNWWIIMSI